MSINPYVTPTVAPTSERASSGSSDGRRTGPSWERDGYSFRTFWQTAKLVLGAPVEMFSTMRRDGGLGGPVLFAVVGGLVGGLANATWFSLLPFSILSRDGILPGLDTGPVAGLAVVPVILTCAWTVVMGTIGVLVGVISGAGIIHFTLMLLGGANQSFEATCRVICYVQGSVALFQVVPCVGPLIGAIYYSVAAIIGIAETHEVSRGKATAALLLPLLVLMVLGMVALGAGVYYALSRSLAL